MRKSMIAILLLSIVSYGQQRSVPPERVLPAGVPGTVTLTLAEYNRLAELAARKPKPAEPPPLPFVMSRASFKLLIAGESMTGTLDIDGEILQKGPTKVP